MSQLSSNPHDAAPALYAISTVSALTGVNSVTLRAWERRYGLLNPRRTPSGHRLYSDEDVNQIRSICQMLDEGIAISQVARALQSPEHTPTQASREPWQRYISQMLLATSQFDEAVLEDIYNEAMSLYPVEVVTRQLLLPLLREFGQRWETSECGIAEEHFFSVFMRNKLGARFHHRNRQNKGPRLVIACLPSEQHEFGLLLLALSLHARGYQLIMLGANMPLSELPQVAGRTQSEGIILSGSVDIGSNQLQQELSDLSRQCDDIPVFIGGPIATRHSAAIERSQVISLGEDLGAGMHKLSRHFPNA
ncbi:MerR family transcriptional regulator [Thiohalophilus sp.]|uniref:MerR family transcriptional regulator n=1 Tax=Thiohalophilus sp. TaxID=3028392 RepID=UPI002ACEC73A|nr:MerR family transcriptional regulator [Thiohalophilus sp.]MDZ7804529.1 MerR family transcriptional regulator [Thiohalophilus sp.]